MEQTPLSRQTAPEPRVAGIIPPLWSCAAVTLAVLLCVGGIAAAFLSLGGHTPPAGPLRLTILTAPPEMLLTAQIDPQSAAIPTLSTGNQAQAEFIMTGPTLPAVIFTATPEQIAVGKTVKVIAVGDQQLNVRERPGIVDVAIVFRAPEGSYFIVGDGPSQGDGLTWWRIDDPSGGRSGWAASNYLVPVALE